MALVIRIVVSVLIVYTLRISLHLFFDQGGRYLLKGVINLPACILLLVLLYCLDSVNLLTTP